MVGVMNVLIVAIAVLSMVAILGIHIKQGRCYQVLFGVVLLCIGIAYMLGMPGYIGQIVLWAIMTFVLCTGRRVGGMALYVFCVTSMFFDALNVLLGIEVTTIITLILLGILLVLLFHKKQKTYSFEYLSKGSYILIIGIAIAICITLGMLNTFFEHLPDGKGMEIIVKIVVLLFIVIDVIVMMLIISAARENKSQIISKQNYEVARWKAHALKRELAREEDTRKFRHDYRNHMMVFEYYLESNDMEAARAYYNTLMEKSATFTKRPYQVGNDLLDYLLEEQLQELEGTDCEIRVEGCIRRKYDEYLLCTIISNLTRNAVEAILRDLSSTESRIGRKTYFHMKLREYGTCLTIAVQNTYNAEENDAKNKGRTIKKDKKNHGIGLYNVESLVERHKGVFFHGGEDGIYSAKITLPFE